ncbi:MAG TPA: tetratricopeptide repeat protein [Gemmatimonadaceae bacterium]|nr:tetratricopeptide repeat protein [Gemmatimonadaceae bacterium]
MRPTAIAAFITVVFGVDGAQAQGTAGGTDGHAALVSCRTAYNTRKTDEAIKWGEKAVKLLPDSSNAHLCLGQAYVQQLSDAAFFKQPFIAGKARGRFDRAVELDSNNYDARDARATYYMYAPAIGGGGMGKARAEAEVARKIDPYRGGLLRGDIEQHDKQIAAAENEFHALMRAYPDSVSPFSRLVNMYQSVGRFAEAFNAIDARLARMPNETVSRYMFAKTSAMSGERLEQGESMIRAYIKEGNFAVASEAHAHNRLGMILEKRKDFAGALAEYEAAARLDPKLEDAKANAKRVRAQRGGR